MRSKVPWLIAFAAVGALLAFLGLSVGSIHVPFGEVWSALLSGPDGGTHALIIRQVRLPQIITAAIAGAGLAASGLIMQTIFRNPLAGPSVLGISSGASLGVALVMLAAPLWSLLPIPREVLVIAASLAGAISVLFLIVLADRRVGDSVTLLIVGLMVGYLCSAIISVLQSASMAQALKSYVVWGMGTFSAVYPDRLPWLVVPVLLGIIVALTLVKPLNALLLGEEYAASMGANVKRVRRIAIWTTGLLAGTITAFCGPVAFLGLATPHVARAFLRTNDHAVLMPASILLGCALAMGCDVVVRVSSTDVALPLNAVTSLLGAPVVLWVLLSGKHWARQ
jgi:iron complex transport system permease protein